MKLFISVGEESADLHASYLIREMKTLMPNVEWYGFGGEKMKAAGVRILYPLPDLAVTGFVEVIKKLPAIRHVTKLALQSWKTEKPDAIVLVDYPGLNLRLAKWAHQQHIPVYYYIAPQAWAWKENRVHLMREVLQHLFVIFPFEEAFFQNYNIPTTFVGHPFIKELPQRANYPSDDELLTEPVIGLMPGSRRTELKNMLPAMLKAAENVRESIPNAKFIFPLAQSLPESIVNEYDIPSWVTVCRDPDYQHRMSMTFAWTSSGTATVENALLGVPMAVVYRSSWINVAIGRWLIRVPYIGMVNLIAQKGICPEFIQEQCHPRQLSRYVTGLLQNPERYLEMISDLQSIRQKLSAGKDQPSPAQALADQLER
jgi:lipid-A-disaccharide synthase